MTKNTKIILGLSGLAIAFYLYNKNKKSKSSVSETPSTGGESPLPPPDKMPTPVPQLPKEDKMREEVHYCKDGFREVIRMTESQWQVSRIAPCLKHGGIDESKTNKGGGLQTTKCPKGQEFIQGVGKAGFGFCRDIEKQTQKKCPQGKTLIQPQCDTAPCPQICV